MHLCPLIFHSFSFLVPISRKRLTRLQPAAVGFRPVDAGAGAEAPAGASSSADVPLEQQVARKLTAQKQAIQLQKQNSVKKFRKYFHLLDRYLLLLLLLRRRVHHLRMRHLRILVARMGSVRSRNRRRSARNLLGWDTDWRIRQRIRWMELRHSVWFVSVRWHWNGSRHSGVRRLNRRHLWSRIARNHGHGGHSGHSGHLAGHWAT